jgi:hypothetical protein
MKLLEIIPMFRQPGRIDEFIQSIGLDNEEEDASVYMKDSLELTNDIKFLSDEQVQGKRIVVVDGDTYEELLPVFMIQEMVDELKEDHSDLQIAQKILSYAINDA